MCFHKFVLSGASARFIEICLKNFGHQNFGKFVYVKCQRIIYYTKYSFCNEVLDKVTHVGHLNIYFFNRYIQIILTVRILKIFMHVYEIPMN